MREVDYGGCSGEEMAEAICQLHALISATQAELFGLLRAFAASESFREDGCRDLASWLVQRLGISGATARAWSDTAGASTAWPAVTPNDPSSVSTRSSPSSTIEYSSKSGR